MKTEPVMILNNDADLDEREWPTDEARAGSQVDFSVFDRKPPRPLSDRPLPELERSRSLAREAIAEIEAELVRRRFQEGGEPPLSPERLELIAGACRAVRGYWTEARYIDVITAALKVAGPDGLTVGELEDTTGIPVRRIENAIARANARGRVVQLRRRRWRKRVPGRRRRKLMIWVLPDFAEGQEVRR